MRRIFARPQFVTATSCLMVFVTGSLTARLAAQPKRIRIVRAVTISQAQLERHSSDLLEKTMARLDQSASFRPDIACLPELFSDSPPEVVPGPVSSRLYAWAREHSCYSCENESPLLAEGV